MLLGIGGVFQPSQLLANPFNAPQDIEFTPVVEEPVEIGSDAITIDDVARKAMEEEEEKQAISLSGAFGALEAPIAKNASNYVTADDASVGEFSFRISAGYGLIENPLKARDDIEVFVLPEFSYYGERFYIENFVLGYSLVETEQFMFDLFGYFNEDGYFFELDGIEKITVASILGRKPAQGLLLTPVEDKTLERNLSYMAGLNTTFRGQWFDIQTSIAADVSGIHHGQEAKIKFRKKYRFGDVLASFSASSTLKSNEINDYYYRIKAGEFGRVGEKDSLGSTVTHQIELHLGYQFTPNVSANLLLQKTWMDEALEASHLVEDLSYYSGFVGLTYRF